MGIFKKKNNSKYVTVILFGVLIGLIVEICNSFDCDFESNENNIKIEIRIYFIKIIIRLTKDW